MNDIALYIAELNKREALKDDKLFFKKYLKIRDRETSEIIPFDSNESQDKLLSIVKAWETKYPDPTQRPTLYIIILKARRQGFSTATEGLIFKRIIREKNKVAMIVSYDDDSAVNINDMSNIFYQYLPQDLKPDRRSAAGKGIILENPKFDPRQQINLTNDPGLQSKFLIETARNMNAGSSFNINYLHLSELAKWPGDVKTTMTSLLQAVPKTNSIVVVESTALGFNYYKELWDGAVSGANDYIPLFIPWFEDKGAVMPYDGFDLTGEEIKLKELYNLSNEQIAWRRWCIKNKCSNDINQFKQEYPASPEEAFLFTGKPVFNNEKVVNRINELRVIQDKTPPKKGYMSYKYDDTKQLIIDSSITFIEDKAGSITIYFEPKQGYPYVIGGDIAEGGADSSTAHVIDNTTGQQVATMHYHTDTDTYAKDMYCLGRYYNDALIGIETNFDTHPVKELERLRYYRQYKREIIDSISNQKQQKHGFKTTTSTRPVIIDELKIIVRDEPELLNDIPTLQEMLTFVRNNSGKPEAMEGHHDDLILGLAITYYVRTQQIYEAKKESKKTSIDQLHGFFTIEELKDIGYSAWEIKQYQSKRIIPCKPRNSNNTN